MIAAIELNKTVTVDQNSIKALSDVLGSEQDNMDEDVSAVSTDNVEKISTLLKLLLLFPNEYYEKNERPQILYLATLLDIWSVSCKNADYLARMKVCLMCRSLQLRFIGYFSVNSILVRTLYSTSDRFLIRCFYQGNGFWSVELVSLLKPSLARRRQ